MGKLYLMITIVDRKVGRKYMELYKESGQNVMFSSLGAGTAASDILDYMGLEATEKVVFFSMQEESSWLLVKKQLQKKMKIDAPGGGIAFLVPFSSIGGKKALQFLLESQNYQKEEESTLKDTVHELIIVIANQGNIELIMDAARGAGAYGGTVIHARGTGMELAEKFMGVSIAAEKEMIFIVTKKDQKNGIMKAIMENAGMDTKAKSIVFSLPVTDTAGLRLIED
ncbi:P-II family nitrogen regulator [Parablautia intestinalis]|jgi:nitrogen regulatory protein PII|uniref:P-II family nitrogen regulator n=1 Tax=Parablautia intestinalis TaxID=2320100 RepID=A0A3A9AKW0_9FIRM|nr:P-II family nitrogen regulator [Parablautia intestinalis]MCI8615167.1 P-II family nitrogen regulator [Lachnospiraceae bacterium]RKI92027.1 P-II family nitrogen regulator [Parablautia intestinalis]